MNHNSYYGAKNSNWKGKSVCKRAEHYRVTAKRGKASDHMCARCHKRKAAEWAKQKKKDGGGYKAFCRHCHHLYDKMINNIQKNDSRYN